MKLGYIIGPFRAPTNWEIQQSVRNAEILGLEVARLGAFPVIPHKNTENFYGLLTDEFWLQGTEGLLLKCDFAITVAAICLPWEQSSGSVGEVRTCKLNNIPLFHNLPRLATWLKQQSKGSSQ
jgi:hypothetical protein